MNEFLKAVFKKSFFTRDRTDRSRHSEIAYSGNEKASLEGV